MKRNLATRSLLLFGLSIVFLVLLTLFESASVGMSLQGERTITFLLLVMPAALGVVLGILSLRRGEGRTALAVAGIALNGLFALFHIMLIFLAG
ncbi:MAG TPA: hypothetical protein VK897_19480 [Anaerolineales bacterium]|nr:hypothetical protein [Anaerolineales bacterium]